jgi:protein gp37
MMRETAGTRLAEGMWWDRAWSLVEGCAHVSAGCAHCWAASATHVRRRQANDLIRARYDGLTDDFGRFNGQCRFMERDLINPLTTRKPLVWAVWNDLFFEGVADADIAAAFGVMSAAARHTFIVCTKRPERLARFFAEFAPPVCRAMARDRLGSRFSLAADSLFESVPRWPLPNVILMTSAENQAAAEGRIPFLIDAPAHVRAISAEPLLGLLDLSPWLDRLGWVVAGCESGTNRRFARREWFESLRDQCAAAGVPYFLKQMELNMRVAKMPMLKGRYHAQMPGGRDRG